MQTVVGLYRTVNEANQVRQALLDQGFRGGDITVIDQSESGYTSGDQSVSSDDTSVGGKIKHFFQGLSGHDEHTHSSYASGISNGGALLAVKASEDDADRIATVLEQYGATDVEGGEGYSEGGNYSANTAGTGTIDSLGSTGSTGSTYDQNTAANTVTGEQVIPVVAEDLVVGKRQVQRGGVRVYSHVVSEPVSESVSLHDERVIVDRRTVDRPATEADFVDAGPIEVRATGEEAVVGKTSRVIEEVVVGKTATDHTETVNDTVRHTEVDVEPVTTGTGTTKTGNNY